MARQQSGIGILSERVRGIEGAEPAQMILVSGNPNGSESAAIGTFAWDTANNDLYVNSNGITTWILIGP